VTTRDTIPPSGESGLAGVEAADSLRGFRKGQQHELLGELVVSRQPDGDVPMEAMAEKVIQLPTDGRVGCLHAGYKAVLGRVRYALHRGFGIAHRLPPFLQDRSEQSHPYYTIANRAKWARIRREYRRPIAVNLRTLRRFPPTFRDE
jgi:hypothetical protein